VREPSILFLDFDGVLHPCHVERDELFCQRHLLWAVLDACPGVEVVFSTTWRTGYRIDDLVRLVTQNGGEQFAQCFVGATPELIRTGGRPPVDEYRLREKECLEWLRGNGCAERRWMALDDVHSGFRFGSEHLYAVDYLTGLTAEDVGAILAKLRESPP